MNKIKWFKNYLKSLQDAIVGINKNKMVITKDQLTDYLSEMSSENNFILIGVMPDFSGKGNNADDFKITNIMQLMILKKTTYSTYNYDDYFQIFEDTYSVIEEVLKKLLLDSLSCNELRFIDVNTIKIEPVKDESSCNGWKVMFNFDMFL